MANSEQGNACLTVFHDGSCPLCRREIALAQKVTAGLDVAYVDVSSADRAASVAPGLSAETAMSRFHVRRADGVMLSGAAAFLELWSRSPRLRWLQRVAEKPILVAALDQLYSLLLLVRPPLARILNRIGRS